MWLYIVLTITVILYILAQLLGGITGASASSSSTYSSSSQQYVGGKKKHRFSLKKHLSKKR